MILAPLLLAATTLTIEDYATMPQPSSPRLSPDGARVAYVVTRGDLERNTYDADLWLVNADKTHNRQLTRNPASDNHPRWSPDGSRLAFLSDRDGGKSQLYLLDPDGGEPQKLTSEPAGIREFEWAPDGKSIAFNRIDAPPPGKEDIVHVVGVNDRQLRLYVVDIESGAVRALTDNKASVLSFDWTPDAKQLVYDRVPADRLDDYYRADLYVIAASGGDPRPLVVRPGPDRLPHVSPDGKWVAFVSSGGIHDWLVEQELYVVALSAAPAQAGELAPRSATVPYVAQALQLVHPVLVSHAYGNSPESIHWSADSKTLWFDGPSGSTSQLFRVNADGRDFANVSNRDGVLADSDIARNKAVFTYENLTTPREVYLSDLNTFAPRSLTHLNEPKQLGETRVLHWKNPQDGLEIEGLLTLPIGYKPGTRVPLLTFVHGGPASRFDQAYLGYLGVLYAPQVLAARGFAILRPNPRGTGGYGLAFRAANRNDWGGMDWVDINAGIDKVIADGIADPDRLGIMGWSYGGYMAAWSLGHSDRFRATSVGAPVVDLFAQHGTSDIRDFIPHYFGVEVIDEFRHGPLPAELLLARSPIRHLKKPRGPVLIQHGEADERVPLSQGTMLYRALDELGADVTMVTYPRSGHVPREPKQRLDVMRRNVEFFSRSVLP